MTRASTPKSQSLLTARALAKLSPTEWMSDPAPRGEGRLLARGLRGGKVAFYYRYTLPDGKRDTFPLGTYDPDGKAGLTLSEARSRAGELKRRYQSGDRDLRAVLDAEQAEARQAREAALAEDREASVRREATLSALLDAYVSQLRRDLKVSAGAVEATIRRHLKEPWPALCALPADEISTDDLLLVLAKLSDLGKLREAAKLRAYVRAAYSTAQRARQDARASPAMRRLKVETNPARDLVTIDGASGVRERALSAAELQAYWSRIKGDDTVDGALLRLHLLTGAQRCQQLGRVTAAELDLDRSLIRLRDGKGRRRTPRIHPVPLLPEAARALKALGGGQLGPYLVSLDGGQSPAQYAAFQHRVRRVAESMAEAGELTHGNFTAGDLRRTVETRLASLGVSADVRAQLQSHGLGGVQARHYDRHDYLEEKLHALEQLLALMEGRLGAGARRGGSKVVALRAV